MATVSPFARVDEGVIPREQTVRLHTPNSPSLIINDDSLVDGGDVQCPREFPGD